MELEPVSPIEELLLRFGPTVVEWYYWILMLAGAAFCVWAVKKTEDKAYILLILFFLYPLAIIGWNRIEAEKYEISEYVGDIPEGAIHHVETFVHLPIAETLLVLGVFLITKRRIRDASKALDSTVTTCDGPDRIS